MAEPRVHTWVTYTLIAANVVMFGVELAAGAHPTTPTPLQLLEVGASFPPLTTNGEWWRLGAAMFLHFGLLHLALNMVCLWQGRVVELLFGRGPFAVLYLVAGLAGGLATLVYNTHAVSAGASGAVFGVYGAFGAFLVLRRRAMPEAVWQQTARGIGMFVAINIIFGLAVPSISLSAHLGGLVIGFLVGLALLARSSTPRPSILRTLAVGAGGLALVVASSFAVPHMEPVNLPTKRAPGLAELVGEFATLETKVIGTWEELARSQQTGQLDDARLAVALERDVLVPWRAGCARLLAAEPPADLRPLFAALDDYCAARQLSWETFGAALRATGDEQQALLTRHRFQEVAVRQFANKVVAEQKRLLDKSP